MFIGVSQYHIRICVLKTKRKMDITIAAVQTLLGKNCIRIRQWQNVQDNNCYEQEELLFFSDLCHTVNIEVFSPECWNFISLG